MSALGELSEQIETILHRFMAMERRTGWNDVC